MTVIFAKNIFLVTLDFLGGNTCQGTTFSRAVSACKMTIPRCRRLARSEAQHIEQMSSAASCNRMACEAECAEKSTGSLKTLEPFSAACEKRPAPFIFPIRERIAGREAKAFNQLAHPRAPAAETLQ